MTTHRRLWHLASRWTLLGALGAGLVLQTSASSATVVERVVAVVGDSVVLLSDLRTRARPYLSRISQQVPAGAQRSAAISQLYETLLKRLVEEQLQERAALKAKVSVTAQEISAALERVAKQNNISIDELMAEANRSGMSEAQYRQEIRRQLLEAKLLNLRVQGRIQVTDADVRASYRELVLEERKQLPFQAAWLLVEIPDSSDAAALQAARTRADALANAARTGADFAELARANSADRSTRAAGGLLPLMKPGTLPAQAERVLLPLEPGEVSAPVRVGNYLAVLKLLSRAPSSLPSLEDADLRVRERVYAEKMAKARERWLESLERQTHVDLRL